MDVTGAVTGNIISEFQTIVNPACGTIAVEEGQLVKAGTLVGRVGNSGNSTHPHLHVHVQNNPTSEQEGRITYPFRFREMQRKRLILWKGIRNSYLLRNDWFSDHDYTKERQP